MKKIVFVGRPNVGKSELFNRLSGKKLAVVYDAPGVTRDWKENTLTVEGRSLTLIDTPGFELEMAKQADHIVFVCDAKEGIVPADYELLRKVRRFLSKKKLTLVVNKAEKMQQALVVSAEAHAMLADEPIYISALHGQGIHELWHVLLQDAPRADTLPSEEEKLPQVVIIGRPNSGKSTLVNALLGQERMSVGPQAGLTRESVGSHAKLGAINVTLFDTPGLRRRGKIKDELEELSWKDSIQAIRFAHVAILLMDATHPFEAQDLRLAQHVIEEGRAIMIVLNKWDLIEDKKSALKRYKLDLEEFLPRCRGIPLLPISAIKGAGLKSLSECLHKTYTAWNKTLKTSDLNRWLQKAVTHHAPPRLPSRQTLSLKYMTQLKSRPPTFIVFTNIDMEKLRAQHKKVLNQYERYLNNSLYETFKLFGTPVRISFRFKNAEHLGERSL